MYKHINWIKFRKDTVKKQNKKQNMVSACLKKKEGSNQNDFLVGLVMVFIFFLCVFSFSIMRITTPIIMK